MKKIKIKSKQKVFTNKVIPYAEYINYIDLLYNNRLIPFITTIRLIIATETSTNPDLGRRYSVAWDTLFDFNIANSGANEITGKNSQLSLIMDAHGETLIPKLHNLYGEVTNIIPEHMIDILKYNFYSTLINDYFVSLETIELIEVRYPFYFLVQLMRNIWWSSHFELNKNTISAVK